MKKEEEIAHLKSNRNLLFLFLVLTAVYIVDELALI